MAKFGELPAFQQHATRTVRIYRDNHQREYEVVVDSKDPALTWVSIPIPKYRVPDKRMFPPPKFLKPVKNEMGRMRVDYDGWLALTLQNEEEYDTALLKICQANNPNDALKLFENPTKEILRLAGPRPMPSDLVRAMRAGNAWALGFKPAGDIPPFVTTTIREWLSRGANVRTATARRDGDERFLIEDIDKFLDYEEQHDPDATGGKTRKVRTGKAPGTVEYTDFVAAKTKEGLTLAEISPLWKEHKAKKAEAAGSAV